MDKWAESFTLYDLFGYFAVGVLSILGGDLAWEGSKLSLIETVKCFNIYMAVIAAIPPYVLGQLLGTASKVLERTVKSPRMEWLLAKGAWLVGSDPPSCRSLRGPIAGEACLGNVEDSDDAVFWLAQDFCRVENPSAYADLFKLLAYSGASRSLCLVSLVEGGIAFVRSRTWWLGPLGLVLSALFFLTYVRIFRQYRREMINTAVVLLADQTSSKP